MNRVASLLRAYHAASGLSWRALAARAGMSSTYLHDVVSGRRLASPYAARRYARALGRCEETWLRAAVADLDERAQAQA